MPNFENVQLILELIGTIAFSISGALLGIRRSMDLFGIVVLGVVTAVGGGIIRDVLLGITPPSAFTNSSFALVAILSAVALFYLFYKRGDIVNSSYIIIMEKYLVFFDAIGLGAFTVVGMNIAAELGLSSQKFLMIFMGMITGIGGGIIRDLLAGIIPFVFIRHVYAGASLMGGVIYLIVHYFFNRSLAMLLGFVGVISIRLLAAKFQWNLPRIIMEKVE